MNCPQFETIDEYLAVGVPPGLLPGQHREHLEACAACRDALEDSLELARLLQEPLPLPPADLTARIMARIQEPVSRSARPATQERLIWAALGAAVPALLLWDPAPLFQSAASLVPVWQLSLPGIDATWGVLGAAALLAAQLSVLWGVRRAEEASC